MRTSGIERLLDCYIASQLVGSIWHSGRRWTHVEVAVGGSKHHPSKGPPPEAALDFLLTLLFMVVKP